jgi:hypothetical protein
MLSPCERVGGAAGARTSVLLSAHPVVKIGAPGRTVNPPGAEWDDLGTKSHPLSVIYPTRHDLPSAFLENCRWPEGVSGRKRAGTSPRKGTSAGANADRGYARSQGMNGTCQVRSLTPGDWPPIKGSLGIRAIRSPVVKIQPPANTARLPRGG